MYYAGNVDHHVCYVLNMIYIYTFLKCYTTEISGLAYTSSSVSSTEFLIKNLMKLSKIGISTSKIMCVII